MRNETIIGDGYIIGIDLGVAGGDQTFRYETAIGDFCEVTKKPCERETCEDCELVYQKDGSKD